MMPEGREAVAPLQNIYSFSHWPSTQDTFSHVQERQR